MSPPPVASVLVCGQPGTDANNGTNGMGPSFFDSRPFQGGNSGYSNGPWSAQPLIPENSCDTPFNDITLHLGFDAQKIGINNFGSADGYVGHDLNVMGADFGSYPQALGIFPSDSNSIAITGGGNFQGFHSIGEYVNVSEQFIGFEAGQLNLDYANAFYCSNGVSTSYSSASSLTMHQLQTPGCVNHWTALAGRFASPIYVSVEDINLAPNCLPNGTASHAMNDQYWESDGMHNGLQGTCGNFYFATNQNINLACPAPDFLIAGGTAVVWLFSGTNGTSTSAGQYSMLFGTMNVPTLTVSGAATVGGLLTGNGAGTFNAGLTVNGGETIINDGAQIGGGLIYLYNQSSPQVIERSDTGSWIESIYDGRNGTGYIWNDIGWNDQPQSVYKLGCAFNFIGSDDLTKCAGFNTNGTMFATGGIATLGTNSVPFASSGITNTLGVDLRVFGFQGNGVWLTNTITGFKANIGSGSYSGVCPAFTITLQPGEGLIGSSCIEITNIAN